MRYRKRLQGFSLIELVMVVALISIISVVFGRILFQAYINFTTIKNITEVDAQGLVAIEKIVNDIHNIRSSNDLSTILATQLTFTDLNNTSVSYQLSAGNLTRNGFVLANVQSLGFTYFSSSGATTATASAVRYIAVAITLTKGTSSVIFSTLVGTRGMS